MHSIFISDIDDDCSSTTDCSLVSGSVCETTCKIGMSSAIFSQSQWSISHGRCRMD